MFAEMLPRMADFGRVIEILKLGAIDLLVEGLESTDNKGTIDTVLTAICDVVLRSRAEGTFDWLAQTIAQLGADFTPEVIEQIHGDILPDLFDLTNT